MGRSYRAIQSFISGGPAWLSVHLSEGSEASLIIESVEPLREVDRAENRDEGACETSERNNSRDARSCSLVLEGPSGHLLLDEDEIVQIQPDGPQEGSSLYISLDNGTELTFERHKGPT